jgi:hypothetical protein
MRHLILLSNDDRWVQVIGRRAAFVHGIDRRCIHRAKTSRAQEGTEEWVAQTFQRLATTIEGILGQCLEGATGLRRVIGVVDIVEYAISPADINPMVRNDWPAVGAMLALAFPEIYWVFRASFRNPSVDQDARLIDAAHVSDNDDGIDHALTLMDAGLETLFDPFGLRNRYRTVMGDTMITPTLEDAITRPLRRAVAVSVDEEESYAYFNAYVAYRIGYRSHVVTSYAPLRLLFGPATRPSGGMPNFAAVLPEINVDVVFEDLFLNFPDRPRHIHLSDLERRADELPGLARAPQHVLVTVGLRTSKSSDTNKAFLARQRHLGLNSPTLPKPLSGIYDVWQRSNIKAWNVINDGYADDFDPNAGRSRSSDSDEGDHSTPGRLYIIASALLRRSRTIADRTTSVTAALYCATLALEAQELLGGRTPTISLEALSLKHEMEVAAECMFQGVEYNLDVRSRYADLEREVKGVCEWFDKKTRENSKLNALSSIVGRLVLRFRALNRYDEETALLADLRRLHRCLAARRYGRFGWAVFVPRWYFETLITSLGRFVFALFLWTAVLSVVYWIWPSPALTADGCGAQRAITSIAEAVSTFFAGELPADLYRRAAFLPVVAALGVISAFIHLGIFVSYLYGAIMRK